MARLAVGDQVRFTSAHLRSLGMEGGDLPFARGTLEKLYMRGSGGGQMAEVSWRQRGIPKVVRSREIQRA